jgi:hypothetical protein
MDKRPLNRLNADGTWQKDAQGNLIADPEYDQFTKLWKISGFDYVDYAKSSKKVSVFYQARDFDKENAQIEQNKGRLDHPIYKEGCSGGQVSS